MDSGRDIKNMLVENYEFRKPIKFQKERVIKMNNYAIQKYGVLCQELYNRGIITNPSVFTYMDFFEYLYDNYEEDCNVLYGNGSKMQRDTLYLEYIISKCKNKYFKELMGIYHDILECEEILELCNDFVNKPNKLEIEITLRCYLGKEFKKNCSINLDNRNTKLLLGCREKSLNFLYLRALSQRVESEGIILDEKKEDERYIDLILRGVIKGKTEYAKKVDNYLTGLNYELTKEELFMDIAEEVIEDIKNNEEDIEYITSSGIYYKEDKKEIKLPKYVGTYIQGYNNESLSVYNCLNGYSGEFISLEEVKEKGYYTKGFPVNLYLKGGKKKIKYYPIFAVYTKYNLEYPLNPRTRNIKQKRIKLESKTYKKKSMTEYSNRLIKCFLDNINSIGNTKISRLKELKIPRGITEEESIEIKRNITSLIE